jgi:hypothetical protein
VTYYRQYPMARSMVVPYVVVQAQLPEGIRLNAHLVGGASTGLRHGLRMIFHPVVENGRPYPGFALENGR